MDAYMWIIWLAIFVLAIIIEACTSEMVSIWFAIGSLVPLIISFIPGVAWWIQVIVFAVISFVTFLFIRPLLKKLIKRDKVDTNIDEIIGKKGIMTIASSDIEPGEAKVNGILWTALNVNEEEPLEKDCKVTVVAINGNKLLVKKVKEENK